jgi:hypothetical protein
MPDYRSFGGNSGQFGNTPYNNPQMGQKPPNVSDYAWFGSQSNRNQNNPWASPQGTGWYNPNAADTQWQLSMMPNESAWQGPAVGHMGQDYSYNPMTGEGGWTRNYQGLKFGGGFGPGEIWNIDPKTGAKQINPSMISMLMERFGVGGANQSQGFTPSEFGGQQVTAPGGYGGFNYDAIGSGIDPSEVIAAQEYKLQEAMEGDMARAGGRAGQSGFAMSTPYMNELGDAARKASQDRNALTLQYQYDAAQQQAARDLAQQLQAGQHDFGSWQTQGGWDMSGQLANQNQAFQQWLAENNWGMQNQQMGMQDQNMQQQMLMSILGGLF